MKGTFKIRDINNECLCALFTEDFVFFNALKDDRSQELFKDVDGGYITVSDLNTKDFNDNIDDSIIFVEEFYLISLDKALSCKDFKAFLLNCEEINLEDDCKEEV